MQNSHACVDAVVVRVVDEVDDDVLARVRGPVITRDRHVVAVDTKINGSCCCWAYADLGDTWYTDETKIG